MQNFVVSTKDLRLYIAQSKAKLLKLYIKTNKQKIVKFFKNNEKRDAKAPLLLFFKN